MVKIIQQGRIPNQVWVPGGVVLQVGSPTGMDGYDLIHHLNSDMDMAWLVVQML